MAHPRQGKKSILRPSLWDQTGTNTIAAIEVVVSAAVHGGKVGRVVYEGKELGWRVVKVKLDDLPQPVSFTPAEVETR